MLDKSRNEALELLGGKETPRSKVLLTAASAVLKDRNVDYGNPENNFRNIRMLWTTRLYIRLNELNLTIVNKDTGKPIDLVTLLRDHDVPIWMTDVKTARIETSPKKLDNWADGSGYMACGYETAIADSKSEVEKPSEEMIDKYDESVAEAYNTIMGTGPFKCVYCPCRFTTENSLKNHKIKTHYNKP